jgi:2-hydroxychromene-2-carboxylate isomerase
MGKTVDYFFSTSSPWSYLGSRLFTEIAAKAGAAVKIWPVDFGIVFPATGGLPLPKRAPARQAYRLQELERWKRRRGIPLVIRPDNFPAKTPLSPKLVIAAREAGVDALELSNRILATLWAEDRSIDDPDILTDLCNEMGLDGPALIAAAQTPAIAAMFEADSKAAIERGVFGAPSFLIDGELFWGQDRIDFVAEKLGVAI